MSAKGAAARRIKALCRERGMAVNALADLCGVPPAAICSMMNEKSKNPGTVSLQKRRDGLETRVRTVFHDLLFENLEPVIQ